MTNLAARLCAEAAGGQILVDRKSLSQVKDLVDARSVGLLKLKGFAQQVEAFAISRKSLTDAEISTP